MEYKLLYSPRDIAESAFVESLLNEAGIRYFIKNEMASGMYPSLALDQRSIFVHPEDYENAARLMEDLQESIPNPEAADGQDNETA